MTHIDIAGLEIGQEIGSREFHLTRDSLVKYAGASGDFNPIHYRDDFAQAVGLPGVLAHGMLTMGVAVQVAADWVGDAGKVIDYGVRFTKPVVVPDTDAGTTVEITGKILELDGDSRVRIDLTVTSEGQKVLTQARAWVHLS